MPVGCPGNVVRGSGCPAICRWVLPGGRLDRRCGASLKRFACGDVIPGCGGVFTGAGDQSVLDQVLAHVAADHGLVRPPMPFIELVMAHTHPFVPTRNGTTCGSSVPTRADGSTPPTPPSAEPFTPDGDGTPGSLPVGAVTPTDRTARRPECAPAGTGPAPAGQGPRDVPARVRAVRRDRWVPGRGGAVRPGRAGPAGTGDGRRRRTPAAGAAVRARPRTPSRWCSPTWPTSATTRP